MTLVFIFYRKIIGILASNSLLFIFIFILGCKKSKKDNDNNYDRPVPQILWDYGFYKAGSYWVYEDSLSHVLDSVYVTSSNYGTKHYNESDNKGYSGDFGWYTLNTHSLREDADYKYTVNQTWTIYGGTSTINRDRSGSDIKGIGGTYLMSENFEEGNTIGFYGSPGSVIFKKSFQQYFINNKPYNNVICIEDTKNPSEHLQKTYFYISKNVGIIKKQLIDSNKVWNLVRHKAIQ